MNSSQSDQQVVAEPKTKPKTKQPRRYNVLLLNDDYTTMDFVVSVLEQVFQKSPAEATRVMLQVHHEGRGLCGVYPKSIAEAKVVTVEKKALEAGYPLKCVMEPEDV